MIEQRHAIIYILANYDLNASVLVFYNLNKMYVNSNYCIIL